MIALIAFSELEPGSHKAGPTKPFLLGPHRTSTSMGIFGVDWGLFFVTTKPRKFAHWTRKAWVYFSQCRLRLGYRVTCFSRSEMLLSADHAGVKIWPGPLPLDFCHYFCCSTHDGSSVRYCQVDFSTLGRPAVQFESSLAWRVGLSEA